MKIVFRADGYKELGLGHIYNCITLAHAMEEHDILMVTREDAREGRMKLAEEGFPVRTISSDQELDGIVQSFRPDIWVNDCLNTTAEYVRHLKASVPRVVTIEDLGTGAQEADAVINAVYSGEEDGHVYSGYRYACLREEFQKTQPRTFHSKVRNVIVMFGGSDPSNMNRVVYRCIQHAGDKFGDIRFNFITGLAYDHEGNGILTLPERNIYVYPNVPRVTDYMKKADLAVIGQGRTIYETAAMGVPSIVLAQNQREMLHDFARLEHGFINLGLGREVESGLLEHTLEWLIHAAPVRRNMYDLMLQHPLRTGLVRVINIIMGDMDD